ncbi:hypothetical protein [Arthrobacter sedimenti]|uniref:hypothetical protein n=1 Tax=Arthrobacter sedimenti TaxID=2694931 RepID=UPI000B34B43D|nr:hypothetical protein [Arthrobacter sedimenti]OUM40980.1 hypothetical protein B8W73_11475 [Arthrobacter agilis]
MQLRTRASGAFPEGTEMATGMGEHEQRSGTCAAFRSTGLTIYDLWLRYFSLGGNAGEEEIDAYLYSSLLLPPFERDILALAVNEYIADLPPAPRATFSTERT